MLHLIQLVHRQVNGDDKTLMQGELVSQVEDVVSLRLILHFLELED